MFDALARSVPGPIPVFQIRQNIDAHPSPLPSYVTRISSALSVASNFPCLQDSRSRKRDMSDKNLSRGHGLLTLSRNSKQSVARKYPSIFIPAVFFGNCVYGTIRFRVVSPRAARPVAPKDLTCYMCEPFTIVISQQATMRRTIVSSAIRLVRPFRS